MISVNVNVVSYGQIFEKCYHFLHQHMSSFTGRVYKSHPCKATHRIDTASQSDEESHSLS